MNGNPSAITLFAALFSLLSIISTIFEYISARLLLSTETVLVIEVEIESIEIARFTHKQFGIIENYRMVIVNEISKIVDIDRRLIELLLPIHTQTGVDLKFYIRTEGNEDKKLLQLVQNAVDSGHLANVCNLFSFSLKLPFFFVLLASLYSISFCFDSVYNSAWLDFVFLFWILGILSSLDTID